MAERQCTIPESWVREIGRMIAERRRSGPDRRVRPRTSIDVSVPSIRRFKAVGWEQLSANRWEYTIQAIDDEEMEVTALNMMESGNTASIAGPGINIDELAEGFELVPVGKDAAGHEVECVFPAWKIGDEWWFCVENAVDGECEAGGGGGEGGGSIPEALTWMGVL